MPTSIDVARARRETPGCERVLHFNNAGAALIPTPVIDAVPRRLERETQIGGYEAADEANEAVERVYDSAARLLGCARDEIAVIENATRSWDVAFYAIPFRPSDRILTARRVCQQLYRIPSTQILPNFRGFTGSQ
jgi:selenocysteine lyase/cysteine desulfurase